VYLEGCFYAVTNNKNRAKDVVGIDLNCGCPKHFSLQGGMGAALLKTPETIEDIVKTLSNNIDKPITIKIRLLEKVWGRGRRRGLIFVRQTVTIPIFKNKQVIVPISKNK
jgi:hypothetical protein